MITVGDLLEILSSRSPDELLAIAFEENDLRYIEAVEEDTDDEGLTLIVLWPEEANVQPNESTEH